MISLGMNPYINSQGFAKAGMKTVLLGAALNIILDPIFIFLLHMGVKGAALATIISQFFSAVWVLRFLTGKQAELTLDFHGFSPDLSCIWEIAKLGVHQRPGSDRLQFHPPDFRRRPLHQRHDGHQLCPGDCPDAGDGNCRRSLPHHQL